MEKTEELIDNLFDLILELDSKDACNKFFKDICTEKEIRGLAQRLEVARLLRKNMTYDEIQGELDVSTSTISRINKVLNYGEGGYKLGLDKLAEIKKQRIL